MVESIVERMRETTFAGRTAGLPKSSLTPTTQSSGGLVVATGVGAGTVAKRRRPVPRPRVSDAVERLNAALASEVPVVYFNGFACLLTTGDVAVVLERNNRPVGLLNMSFTTAKSLSIALGGTVSGLEARTDRDMLTAFDLERLFEEEEAQR